LYGWEIFVDIRQRLVKFWRSWYGCGIGFDLRTRLLDLRTRLLDLRARLLNIDHLGRLLNIDHLGGWYRRWQVYHLGGRRCRRCRRCHLGGNRWRWKCWSRNNEDRIGVRVRDWLSRPHRANSQRQRYN
jgi:hypothetical protein